jgi:acyl-[acyl-carrier-protein]-phospholipid O-acyltransferase/long-chain-fatty-acid--[acyl-carrier-protein] ligase
MKKIAYFLLAWFLRQLVRFIGRIIFRLRITGEKNVPSTGGALLVANHASYMDFVLIVASIPRPVSFVMNVDVFRKPSLRGLLEALNCIPINPREGKNNLENFNQAVSEQVLAGNIVVIFAEGTVSRTGQMLEFKKGVEHLSARIGDAPVIPVHFDNVQGTPFTYRGGKKQRERFSFKSIRREVLVNIGTPFTGKVTAFSLRQRMKEMEVDNFQSRVRAMKTLDARVYDVIRQAKFGEWMDDTARIAFHTLPDKMAQLNVVLRDALQSDQRIAVLLPKTCDAYMLNLWLLLNRKTVVNIDPEFTNEERFYVYNKAQVKTLITTRDLTFTRWAPTAETVIYIEDIIDSLEKGIQLNVLTQRVHHWQQGWNKMFQPTSQMEEEVVLFFRKKNREEIRCVALTHTNLLAVLTSIRQVYHFQKGSRLLANIDLSNSYGYVLELLLPLVCDLKLDIVTSQNHIEEYLDNLFSFEPSLVLASPAQLNALAETAQLKNIPFLKTVFTADIHPNEQAIASLTARGIQVMVCAGMAETSSLFALNNHNYTGKDIVGKPLEQENAALGTIGKPIPGVALKICDEQDHLRELSHDEEGVIWVKGPSVALTRKEQDGCNPILVDGWFNTGWKGSVNHKGFVMFLEAVAGSIK